MVLDRELKTAVNLAQIAGRKILEFYKSGITAEEKIGVDNFVEPVTIADKTASQIIVKGLREKFPDDGVLSEEEPDNPERLTKKRVWMIDPLDGTAGFIKRDGDFAIQIGLTENREPIVGVVFLPNENLLYFASKSKGAFLVVGDSTPKQLKVSQKTDFSEINLAVSRNHYSPKMSRVVEEFAVRREIKRGSVGLKIGLIAQKICDLYIHLSPRTKQWDTCAPEIILREAGGDLTDLFGEKITYNTHNVQNFNGILASNGVTHRKAVEKLRPLLTEFGRLRVKNAGQN
jgi:3'(2'), 5'-bisphosphate nucleotidase